MKKLAGMKIAMCQMSVVPGRPDLNADYVIREIEAAEERGMDVIVFPEMCISGYVIGDKYEDEDFVRDVTVQNDRIRQFTRGKAIAVILGSLDVCWSERGEDGRVRKENVALVFQNGKLAGRNVKALQPNYRIFDDDRQLFSLRKQSERVRVRLEKLYQPVVIATRIGEVKIGTILCEDMWHEDYAFNPTEYLARAGAEIVFNLSASPWSWQKNRKRHSVVKNLLAGCRVPFVYVNNTGVQNNGKNIVIFDGSSTAYDAAGEIVFAIPPYAQGSRDLVLAESMPAVEKIAVDDTAELYLAERAAISGAFQILPADKRKAIIGLSGGIDSALDAALLTDILGAENVFAFTMPSQYTSAKTLGLAQQIAANLGIKIETVSIQGIVAAIAEATGCEPDTLAYENIQARSRMEILAAQAQKLGGVFIGNCNKVETAFGYGTLHGDIAGFILPLGDLVKREVYQLADYLNRAVFDQAVIPEECFRMAPTAELKNDQRDPFDYGNLTRRGYHDEMVRAFTEFRKSPEWFLELYLQGKLESELELEVGTLNRLFPSPADFVQDLERCWQMFHIAVFKRVQAPPIPIVSKRAFGFDLRESMLGSYRTAGYERLREGVFSGKKEKKRIAIYGGSFNPPGRHHIQIAEKLTELFDLVIVAPCGKRPDKPTANIVELHHRAAMAELAFSDITRVKLDLHDLEAGVYTPTYDLQQRYEAQYPEAELWHVAGADIIAGGHAQQSEIHRTWTYGGIIWQTLRWAVLHRPGYALSQADMPPLSGLVELTGIVGSGTLIRERLALGQSVDDLVIPAVVRYICDHNLFKNP